MEHMEHTVLRKESCLSHLAFLAMVSVAAASGQVPAQGLNDPKLDQARSFGLYMVRTEVLGDVEMRARFIRRVGSTVRLREDVVVKTPTVIVRSQEADFDAANGEITTRGTVRIKLLNLSESSVTRSLPAGGKRK